MPRPGARYWNTTVIALAVYFLLCVGLRIIASPTLEADDAEQALLSQYLALGYGPQPPFYNWLLYGTVHVFGLSVATLTVLKQLFLFLCCLFYGLAARLVIKDMAISAIAMLGILTLPPVFLLSQRDLSHTVAALFAVSLFLYFFLRTLQRPSFYSYVMTGVAVGIGVISKYNFVLVPCAAILAILPERELRARIFDWRVIVSMLVAAVIFLPHGSWVISHINAASDTIVEEMKEGSSGHRLTHIVKGTFSLLSAIAVGSALPMLFFAVISPARIPDIWRAQSQGTRVVGRMLFFCLVGVFLVVLGIDATHIRQKWLAVFLILWPLYLGLKLEAANINLEGRFGRTAIPVFVIITTVVIGLSARAYVSPMIGDYGKTNMPFHGLFAELTENGTRLPALVMAGDSFTAGNTRLNLPDVKVLSPSLQQEQLSADLLSLGPTLIVWSDDGKLAPPMPEALKEVLIGAGVTENALHPNHTALPYFAGKDGDRYGFGYLWLSPHQ